MPKNRKFTFWLQKLQSTEPNLKLLPIWTGIMHGIQTDKIRQGHGFVNSE